MAFTMSTTCRPVSVHFYGYMFTDRNVKTGTVVEHSLAVEAQLGNMTLSIFNLLAMHVLLFSSLATRVSPHLMH